MQDKHIQRDRHRIDRHNNYMTKSFKIDEQQIPYFLAVCHILHSIITQNHVTNGQTDQPTNARMDRHDHLQRFVVPSKTLSKVPSNELQCYHNIQRQSVVQSLFDGVRSTMSWPRLDLLTQYTYIYFFQTYRTMLMYYCKTKKGKTTTTTWIGLL